MNERFEERLNELRRGHYERSVPHAPRGWSREMKEKKIKLIISLLLVEITLHFAEVIIDMMQLLKLV